MSSPLPRSLFALVPLARQMRRLPTASEHVLWEALRNRRLDGVKFRRQHPAGRYIVDFYAASHRLVVEVDGCVHDSELVARRDALRQDELVGLYDLRVVRVSADVVLENLAAALADIRHALVRGP